MYNHFLNEFFTNYSLQYIKQFTMPPTMIHKTDEYLKPSATERSKLVIWTCHEETSNIIQI
jgi:hypothetical protein